MQAGQRVRSVNDGQLGVTELDDEGWWVRLDRPKGVSERRPLRPGEWVSDEAPKLTPMAKAMICYAADKAYQESRGVFKVMEWRSLGDNRAKFLSPTLKTDDKYRKSQWETLWAHLDRA